MSSPTETNVIDFTVHHGMFRNPDYRFEVSSRKIVPGIDALDYLRITYPYLDMGQIESVFGNGVYPSRFYGGRGYNLEHSLTDVHAETLNGHGIGISLTMTGHYFDEDVYRANRHFLERYHRKGNAVICTNDDLARRIREDFDDYLIKASLIKHLDTVEKVTQALTLYDRVVIPMDKNDDDAFLESLPDKDRIVLFANANCAYNCPVRTCYQAISRAHWGKAHDSACSKKQLPRPDAGHIFFNVDKLSAMGFHHFKMVPSNNAQADVCLRERAAKTRVKRPPVRKAVTLHSFPKCGRTWLRMLIAHYFNRYFALNVPINLQTVFTLIPNDHAGLKGKEHFQFSHVTGMPLITASHAMDHPGNDGDILLLRTIPDVVVSDFFQLQKLGVIDDDMDDFIVSSHGSLKLYCRFLNKWARNPARKRMHLLTYEGLHHDTENELARLLNHLSIPVDAGYVASAVKNADFKHMQLAEKTSGHAGMGQASDNPEMMKVRKGQVNGFTDYLTERQIRQLQSIVQQHLSPEARAMITYYGLSIDFAMAGQPCS